MHSTKEISTPFNFPFWLVIRCGSLCWLDVGCYPVILHLIHIPTVSAGETAKYALLNKFDLAHGKDINIKDLPELVTEM